MIPRPSTRSDMEWIESRVGVLTRSATGISAIRPDGAVGGVVAFDSWHPGSVQVHIAAESPLAWRALCRVVWDYAFNQEKVGAVLATIPSHRWQAVQMAIRLGFKESHRVREGFSKGSDLVFFYMRREMCRFLQPLAKAA